MASSAAPAAPAAPAPPTPTLTTTLEDVATSRVWIPSKPFTTGAATVKALCDLHNARHGFVPADPYEHDQDTIVYGSEDEDADDGDMTEPDGYASTVAYSADEEEDDKEELVRAGFHLAGLVMLGRRTDRDGAIHLRLSRMRKAKAVEMRGLAAMARAEIMADKAPRAKYFERRRQLQGYVKSRRQKAAARKRLVNTRPAPLPCGKYLVERIIGYELVKPGSLCVGRYRVKWVGYPSSESSWEPALSLERDVPHMCRDYVLSQRELRAGLKCFSLSLVAPCV